MRWNIKQNLCNDYVLMRTKFFAQGYKHHTRDPKFSTFHGHASLKFHNFEGKATFLWSTFFYISTNRKNQKGHQNVQGQTVIFGFRYISDNSELEDMQLGTTLSTVLSKMVRYMKSKKQRNERSRSTLEKLIKSSSRTWRRLTMPAEFTLKKLD